MLARVAVAIVLVGAIFACAPSIFAAPLTQSILRDFVASAKTTISITITLAGGQTIVVPVTVIFGLQNDSTWGGKASVDAEVVQQPGMTIAVQKSGYIDASIVAYNAAPVAPAAQPVVIVATPTVAPPTVMAVVIAPTPTLTPQFSLEEQAFMNESVVIADNYSGAFGKISELLTQAGSNSVLIFDETWKIQMATAMVLVQSNNDHVREITPPARFISSWNEMRNAADLYDLAIEALVAGIDNLDAAEFAIVNQRMNEGNAALNRAAALLPQ